MEDRKPIKISLSTFFLIIAIIVIIVMGFTIYKLYNDKNTTEKQLSSANENIANISKELKENTAQKDSPVEKNTTENTNNSTDEKIIVPSLSTGTLKNAIPGCTYDLDINDNLCMISLKSGVPYISWNTNIKDEKINRTIDDLSKDYNLTLTNETQKITGFNKKVVDVHIGGIGQDVSGQVYIFQMEDGTIEYSTIENMMKNVSSQGKIEPLKNIVKIQDSIVDDNLSGWVTVVAIDKDNNCYDLDEYIDNR